jgi:Uma2 family endonuclease
MDTLSTEPQAVLSRRRFDVDEYHRMIRAGILDEGERVELLDGEIVEMHSIGSRHFACVARLNDTLASTLSGRAIVSIQGPVRLDRHSEPEPDVAVFRSRDDFYCDDLPAAADTLLLMEVADSSLLKDRTVKLTLYAAAGVPEVWLVDLTTDTVEVHRHPDGRAYGQCGRLTEGIVSPLAFPDLQIDVARILPSGR